MYKEINFKLFILSTLLLSVSCGSKKSENIIDNNSDIFITTVKINLVPVNGGDTLIAECYDMDSFEGSNYSGQCDNWGVGEFNKTYLGSVQFLNENVEPTQDLTNEIINNGTNYQVLFGTFTSGQPYTYEYLQPFDDNGNPIGINFKIHSSNENCALVDLLLVYGGSQKSIPHIAIAEGFGGEVFTGDIIASGHIYVECNYD